VTATLATKTSLDVPNLYVIETPKTPALDIKNGMVAYVIDASGDQQFNVAAGGKLILTGSNGNNQIVFQDYTASQLKVTHNGATVIFTDNSQGAHQGEKIASIATDLSNAALQTVIYSDGTHVDWQIVGADHILKLGTTVIPV